MINCAENWRRIDRGGFPGPDHPYTKIKKLLKANGFREQFCGDIFGNGEVSTNFFNESDEVIHLSYEPMADDERLEYIKGDADKDG